MPEALQYTVGSEDALATYGLEKVAWAALAARGLAAARAAMPAIKSVGGKALSAVSKPIQAAGAKLAPYAAKAEQAAVSGAGKVFGQRGQQIAQNLIPGMGKAMAHGAIGQGLLGGAIEGGINAYTAEPGDRMKAFGKGFAHGAATGAVGGAITGAAGHAIQGAAGMGLKGIAAKRGIADPAAAVAATQQAGFFGNVKNLATGKGPLGRAGAATHLAGSLGDNLGANMLLPMYLPSWAGGSGGGGEQPAQPMQRTAADTSSESAAPEVSKPTDEELYNYLMAPSRIPMAAGSALGGAGTGILLDALDAAGHLPQHTLKKILLQRLLPVAGTLAGGTAGYYAGAASRDLSGNPL